jgi:hypothetical protein
VIVNAGISHVAPLTELSLEAFRKPQEVRRASPRQDRQPAVDGACTSYGPDPPRARRQP